MWNVSIRRMVCIFRDSIVICNKMMGCLLNMHHVNGCKTLKHPDLTNAVREIPEKVCSLCGDTGKLQGEDKQVTCDCFQNNDV